MVIKQKVSSRTQELIDWSADHLIGVGSKVGDSPDIVYEGGHGIWIRDTEGNEYIMMDSMGACYNLGLGVQEIVDAAKEQMSKLPHCFNRRGMACPATIECTRKLVEVTPEGLDYISFTSGGAEATDLAFNITHRYFASKGERRYKIISLYVCYHGFGVARWSSNRVTFDKENWGPPGAGFIQIPHYHCYRCMFGLTYPDCGVKCARYLAEVIEYERPRTVAAFIAEPFLGGSGHIHPVPEYFPIIRKICDDYGTLFIADEVQSGFTRAGKMFCVDNWNVKPDIITMAKALAAGYFPIGGVAINDKIYQALKGGEWTELYTFSGHPAACATATATMKIYVRDRVAENAAKVGKHIYERLKGELGNHPCVGSISYLGMSLGMDIVADKKTKASLPLADRQKIRREMRAKGLHARIIEGTGQSRLMIYPPCTTTMEEADKMLDIAIPIISAIKPL